MENKRRKGEHFFNFTNNDDGDTDKNTGIFLLKINPGGMHL